MIDFFKPPATPEEAILRRIKGNHRRFFIYRAIREDGLESIPPAWLDHDLSEVLKNLLGARNPAFRGGEDLPDLDDGEVEIARLTLTNAVHGEVTSLRARPDGEGGILLRMVDEYDTAFELPRERIDAAPSAGEIVAIFRDAVPSPMETTCEIELQSWFYPDLDSRVPRGGE